MTLQEFSNEFDLLYNNIASNQAPGLDEYEKSVFLTEAQLQLINAYFNPKVDGEGGGFDGSHKRQYDFSKLIKTVPLQDVSNYTAAHSNTLNENSKVYIIPKDYFLAVNESALDGNLQKYSVVPLRYDEYQRVLMKPYSYPPKRVAWRLNTNTECTLDIIKSNGSLYSLLLPYLDKNFTLGIKVLYDYEDTVDDVIVDYNSVSFIRDNVSNKIIVYYNSNDSATIELHTSHEGYNDTEVFSILKYGFKKVKEFYDENTVVDTDLKNIITITSGFIFSSVRSTESLFSEESGAIFYLHTKELPSVEIIGRFKGDVVYTLKYVKKPTPIILDDLSTYSSDLSIDGISTKTECVMPIETHREILERAVLLAKIAWQGGAPQKEGQ